MTMPKRYNREVCEWDEAKRQANLAKHGRDFADIYRFDWDTAMVAEDNRHDEPRWVATGYIGDRLCVAVYSIRNADVVRLISLRNATAAERRRYAEA